MTEESKIQDLVNKAESLKEEGDLEAALACYSDTFDMLTDEARKHAQNKDGAYEDGGKSRKINPQFFSDVKSYLKSDSTAAVISNNMALLFAQLNDIGGARKFLHQAVDLTPDGIDYEDPKENWQRIFDESYPS